MGINKVPTLILGIGGIGCRIASNINDLLSPEAKKHIALIGIDTNVNDLTKLSSRGMRTIQTSDTRMVSEYLEVHPEYMRWFPVNKFTVGRTMLNGAGQIRTISRLATLAAEESGAFIPIKEELRRIRANTGEASNGNLTVMVVGSITGGTGAGMFLQIPYYVRNIMHGETGLKNIIIRGMFVGPDLTVDVQPSNLNKAAVRVNAYACLKELNALYRRQTQAEGPGKLKIDFYTPSTEDHAGVVDKIRDTFEEGEFMDEDYDLEALRADSEIIAQGNPDIPYDYLYLIEGNSSNGSIGNASLENVEALVARMVHTLMFTPVKDNALSVEDNMVLQDMEKGGMNRYSSAGLARLIYPKDLAQEYVTLCTVRDLVRNEWMLIDNSHNADVRSARSLQRTDGQVRIPSLKDSYIAHFDKQATGEGSLGKLFLEAYHVDEDRTHIRRSQLFFNNIRLLIDQLKESPELSKFKADCTVNVQNMRNFSDASDEIIRLETALSDYEKLARQLANERASAIANALFPPSRETMADAKREEFCVYRLLHNVHPVTARFLCYDMINLLQAKVDELNGSENVPLGGYAEADFDSKEDGRQTASDALQNLEDKIIPAFKFLVNQADAIKPLRRRLSYAVNTQYNAITNFLDVKLELNICRTLLKRFQMLAENYFSFFQSIDTMIQENTDQIARLENLEMPLGAKGIYCSKDAFQIMAASYAEVADNELTTATKTAVFEGLFGVLADEVGREGSVMTDYQKAAYAAEKAATLGDLFRTAVVGTIRTSVMETGDSIINLNIRQAMEAQYKLDHPKDKTLNVYLRELVENGMRMASPMVATSNNALAEKVETVYMTINPLCAATHMGKPSAAATKELYVPQACEASDNVSPTVLMDEEFSPYEIICFKARYKFSIEDLTKYGPTSDNARAYKTRISNLGRVSLLTSDPDSVKAIVSPHLDRNWHEEAYLPAIYDSERKKNRLDTYKAFIYGLGLDVFTRGRDEERLDDRGEARLLWYQKSDPRLSREPVKVRGSLIGNNYTDLFNALPFNGRIKRNILRLAALERKDCKGFWTAEDLEHEILNHDLVEDLVYSRPDPENPDDQCILDIFHAMRGKMEDNDWRMLFNGLQEVLWEYCAYMFDENERLVNNATRAILNKMISCSKVYAKPAEELTFADTLLKDQVKHLLETPYRRK
jgi:hypothetical protein